MRHSTYPSLSCRACARVNQHRSARRRIGLGIEAVVRAEEAHSLVVAFHNDPLLTSGGLLIVGAVTGSQSYRGTATWVRNLPEDPEDNSSVSPRTKCNALPPFWLTVRHCPLPVIC